MKTNYLNTGIKESDLLHGNIDLIKLLSVVGLIILLLAVINYVNLTTASYRNRMKEIGS
jgi:putative ABC transport system permease protein